MSKVSKRSAASRKAWRTRKRMKKAREIVPGSRAKDPTLVAIDDFVGLLREASSHHLLPPNPFLEIGR